MSILYAELLLSLIYVVYNWFPNELEKNEAEYKIIEEIITARIEKKFNTKKFSRIDRNKTIKYFKT